MVRGTFSPARARRPAVVARLARTLGCTKCVFALSLVQRTQCLLFAGRTQSSRLLFSLFVFGASRRALRRVFSLFKPPQAASPVHASSNRAPAANKCEGVNLQISKYPLSYKSRVFATRQVSSGTSFKQGGLWRAPPLRYPRSAYAVGTPAAASAPKRPCLSRLGCASAHVRGSVTASQQTHCCFHKTFGHAACQVLTP